MSDKQKNNNDSNKGIVSIQNSQQQKQVRKQENKSRGQSSMSVQILQNILSSNQQLIKTQSMQIKSLHNELMNMQSKLKKQQQKSQKLEQQIRLISNYQELNKKFAQMQKHIEQLQNQLVQTKIQLAIQNHDSLQKDAIIYDLNNKNKVLDQELQRMSTISQSDTKSQGKIKLTLNNNQNNLNNQLQINKQNLQNFIQTNVDNNQSMLSSLRSIMDKQIFKKNTSSQIDSVLKVWQKQVNQHILPKPRRFSFSSMIKKQVHLQKFMKQTNPILKKFCGMPHIYRNKVWSFITQDKLGISNALYIQILDRRNRGWVSQKIKLQIEKDIVRSFNGQGSKQKLLKIYEIGLNKSKLQYEQKPTFTRRKSVSTTAQIQILQRQSHKYEIGQKQLRLTSKSPQRLESNEGQKIQPKTQSYFRIAQDVTQVLQLFYIYRPDIGFVQGMTYPTIVLTLVTGKLNSFRILCNLLLCNDFFKKMITFQPNFINYFCRIFDQLLLSYNLNLYNRLFKQFQIKSQVFLVDWFFTFFSRGITPMTILRIWDLFLYHSSLNPKAPQLVLYRLSLIIFQLLEPILMQVNYEESIRTIRQYARKLDQQELIKKLYESMKDSSDVKTFQQKYLKVKLRVEKKYYVEDQTI